MAQRAEATLTDLRNAIACLPLATRVAMLEGLRQNEIVVGAYSHDGGICPMLAAHRAGGRTSFIGFARAWDRFAFRGIGRRRRRRVGPRRATDRELLILRTHLEASLLEEPGPGEELRAVIGQHREAQARTERERARELEQARERQQARRRDRRQRPGDPDRSRELRTRPGWGWMRIVRRYDDYQRALARLEAEEQALTPSLADPVGTPERTAV